MFRGSIVALITPFTQDNAVDYPCLKKLIEWHIQEGTDGIVLCGTTGESPTLNSEELLKIVETGVASANGRIPIIAGTGSYSTARTVEVTRKVKEIGADGALVIVPYYNRPSPEGCFLHYQEIDRVGLPMIIYHHPGRTGVKLSAATLKTISSLETVVGIKEASGDMNLSMELLQNGSKPILSGDDSLTIPVMASGGTGVISVVANLIPKEWKMLTELIASGLLSEALVLFKRYYPICKAMGLETNPQCVKYALSLMGKCSPAMRLPLIEPQESTKQHIRSVGIF